MVKIGDVMGHICISTIRTTSSRTVQALGVLLSIGDSVWPSGRRHATIRKEDTVPPSLQRALHWHVLSDVQRQEADKATHLGAVSSARRHLLGSSPARARRSLRRGRATTVGFPGCPMGVARTRPCPLAESRCGQHTRSTAVFQ